METNRKLVVFRLLVWLVLATGSISLYAQTGGVSGFISAGGNPLPGVSIFLPESKTGTTSAPDGSFSIQDLKPGKHLLQLRFLGFRTLTDTITIGEGQMVIKNFEMEDDALNLEELVITGTRSQIQRHQAPVIINTIPGKIFETTQSLSIAEGLSFSPGLRMENNCQNCGFTQLRMNGLDGPYSQILINSRPVFSALAGVYGLEMMPANMVDRIEVVRGGGSVLYGGNAIAGTINILTKDPITNSIEAGINQSFINFENLDRTITLNGSVVDKNLDKGISFFGFNRHRQPWDANQDGYSELVKLRNITFGLDGFLNLPKSGKLKAGVYYLREFRRGGNRFDLLPHQADLAEQLQHNILSANLSYEYLSPNLKHKFSVYGSTQLVDRKSYYGAGGRIIEPGDTLTEQDILALNAYGNSEDVSANGGFQHSFEIHRSVNLTSGLEYNHNQVSDQMPGYDRNINQRTGTLGAYTQLEIRPIERLTLLLGGRWDQLSIRGNYDLGPEKFPNRQTLNVPVPRLSALYNIQGGFKLRASFAQGYRGPQAFDEDLHIETVGGAARFIRLSPDLTPERSNSALLSLNWDKTKGKNQLNFVAEGFFTQLKDPFILSDLEELPSGISVITKRNGSGAVVSGANLEANYALGSKFIFQSGATLQSARYAEPEVIWEPEDETDLAPAAVTDKILRTPNAYGFFTLVFKPSGSWIINGSGTLTGPMVVPHVIDPESGQTVLKQTPGFFEANLKITYILRIKDDFRVQFYAGVQNMANSYQKDFDTGPERDAGYVYGPLRPRTGFIGMKFGWN